LSWTAFEAGLKISIDDLVIHLEDAAQALHHHGAGMAYNRSDPEEHKFGNIQHSVLLKI
jgi:hypothetical protein